MDLNNLAGKAGEFLSQHPDQVDSAADKLGEVVKEKFGHGDQVDAAIDKLKDAIPGESQQPAPPAPDAPPAPPAQ